MAAEIRSSGVLRALGQAGIAVLAAVGTGACAQEPASSGNYDYVNWDQYQGGAHSSQYSALDQINRDNVSRLEVAWTFETESNTSFNPLVLDGVMYVRDGGSVVALNATNGQELWRSSIGPSSGRGMNFWQSDDGSDRRLLFVSMGNLVAIDADTGEQIEGFSVDIRTGMEEERDPGRPLSPSNPGRIFEDIFIVSLPAGGASYNASPADIHAFNILTGELEWVFHTVPRPGEFGADTWPNNADGLYGGVHNWSELTVDEELGIAYIPTGTARYDFYGGNRPGDNLFGNSILALDARTGERLWHFQTIHHDLWDYDLPQSPKLLNVMRDGEEVSIVAQASKQGFVYVFERLTGEPIWPIEERPVPQGDVPGEWYSPTQPFPTAPPPFARQGFDEDDINPYLPEEDQARLREMVATYRSDELYQPPSMEGTLMLPGHNGGANWGSGAVDPENGYMFIVAKEISTTANIREPGAGRGGPGGGGPGGRGGRGGPPAPVPGAGEDFVRYTVPVDFMMQSNGLAAVSPPWSTITAYDLNEGTIMWQVPNGEISFLADYGITNTGSHAPRGGPVATAGGLLFVGTSSDRKFRARDIRDGSVLWEHDLPAASEGVPAVYAVDGRQYVAVPVSGGGLFANFPQDPPGPSQYMVFALPEE